MLRRPGRSTSRPRLDGSRQSDPPTASISCHILLVEGNGDYGYGSDNEAVVLGASEVSNSFGWMYLIIIRSPKSSKSCSIAKGPSRAMPLPALTGLRGSGEKPVLVTVGASGLTPNTEYHFRVVTKNGKGTLQGPDIVFRTLSVTAPSVETKGAGSIGETAATVYASVNPRGGTVSTCKFEYGTSTSYGSSASCSALPGSGSSPVEVDASIASGLAANTEYHYRISATNSSGTSKGGDATFKTS
jgi:hypothetical protein